MSRSPGCSGGARAPAQRCNSGFRSSFWGAPLRACTPVPAKAGYFRECGGRHRPFLGCAHTLAGWLPLGNRQAGKVGGGGGGGSLSESMGIATAMQVQYTDAVDSLPDQQLLADSTAGQQPGGWPAASWNSASAQIWVRLSRGTSARRPASAPACGSWSLLSCAKASEASLTRSSWPARGRRQVRQLLVPAQLRKGLRGLADQVQLACTRPPSGQAAPGPCSAAQRPPRPR